MPTVCIHWQVLAATRQLLPAADELRIFPNYSARGKMPDAITSAHAVTWHQDAGLRSDGAPATTPVAQRQAHFGLDCVVNCWTPLVAADRKNGCMKFVPNSHRRGIVPHSVVGTYLHDHENDEHDEHETLAAANAADKKFSGAVYSTAIVPEVIGPLEASAVDVECERGDLVLFNNLLFHRGGACK